MTKVTNFLKNFRPLKLLTVCFAAIIVFLTQACAPTSAAQPPEPDVSGNSGIYVPKGDKTLSPYQGGMNNFSDVDPRKQGAATDAKARGQALKENSKQHLIDQSGNVGENTKRILDKKDENAEQFSNNLKRSADITTNKAEDSAENFVSGTKRGIENIKSNTKDAVDSIGKTVDRATDDVMDMD